MFHGNEREGAITIPAFNELGVLPEGVHSCSEEDFRALLVTPFPPDSSRHDIARGFEELRDRALTSGVAGTQWVDGSFVTTKPDPGDVDAVTFVRLDVLNALDVQGRTFVTNVMAAGPAAQQGFRTDSYIVAVADPGHPHHDVFEQWRAYWRKWFGNTRPVTDEHGNEHPGIKKGLVSIGLGALHLQPIVADVEGVQS